MISKFFMQVKLIRIIHGFDESNAIGIVEKIFSFSIDTVFTLCARMDLSERS